LHSRHAGRTWWTPNEHEPWPLHEAEVLEFDDNLMAAAAIQTDRGAMCRALWSPGVHARFGRPQRVG
jgi:hypothetical protein